LAPVGEWVEIGPTRIGAASTGVLFSIAFDAGESSVIFVASPFCGLWRTEDAGVSWLPVTDSLLSGLGVGIANHAVATDPSTPGRVYVIQGGILYRSDDRGNTRSQASQYGVGAGVVPAVTDLIVDPFQPQVLHARMGSSCWRSNDRGYSWFLTKSGAATSLVLDPTQQDVLYVGIPGEGVYRTLDGGESGDSGWTNLTPTLSMMNVYDVKVALTCADPQTIYARFQKHLQADVYRSVDGGTSWDLQSSPSIYTAWIAGDDANAATVFIAGVDFYRSDDGGVNWAIKPGAHVDHHKIVADPSNPSTIYTACDGGIYRSPDRAESWEFIGEGISNTLFYDLALAATEPETTIGGTQDNGTALYDGSSTAWKEILGGDGATVAIDPTDASVMYAMNQAPSSIARSTDGGASFHAIADGLPTGAVCFNFHFQVHPTHTNILLGSCGSLWSTQQPGAQPWSELFTPPDAPNDAVIRSAIDPSFDIYYAATARGKLYAATSGADWQLVFTHPSGWGFSDLVVDPDDTATIYAALRLFGEGRVYRLRRLAPPPEPLEALDVSGDLPAWLNPQTLAVDAMNPFTIYAGTGEGAYVARIDPDLDPVSWSSYSIGMPNADVRALRVHPTTGVMRAATFGRSAYEVNTGPPIGSLLETVGCISFLRAHDVGTGYGRAPNFLDCEVIVLLAEQPYHAFGFKLRADQEACTRREMLDLLREGFVAERPVRIDYVKTGPRVGEIIRVAQP
jgi:hypothetical protein